MYEIQRSKHLFKKAITEKDYAKFWKKRHCVDESTFFEHADSGDILLFTGRHIGAFLQRNFFAADFDHVGIILKYEDEMDLYFLDATMQGITLTPWRRFRDWKDSVYSKVVYRHLEVERDLEFLENLDDFVKGVNGGEYKLNFEKIMRGATFGGKSKGDDEEEAKKVEEG